MENVLVSLFKVKSEAYQAFVELKAFEQKKETLISQGVLVKRKEGSVVVVEAFDALEKATDKMLTGGLVGAVVGLLGGPLGVLFGASLGAWIGSDRGLAESAEELTLLEMVSEKLQDEDVAIIALVKEADEKYLDDFFNRFDTSIMRWSADTVQEEVEEAIEVQKALYRQSKEMIRQKRQEENKGIGRFTEGIRKNFEELRGRLNK